MNLAVEISTSLLKMQKAQGKIEELSEEPLEVLKITDIFDLLLYQ